MQIPNFDDLTEGTRFAHKKTGDVYELLSVAQAGHAAPVATLRDENGKEWRVPASVLGTLYSQLEPEDPPAAALPIGSVRIVAIDPEPEPSPPELEPELVFRRKGRPMNERRPDFKSYFGEPRKDGPNPTHWKKKNE